MSADVNFRRPTAAPAPRDIEHPSPFDEAWPSIVRPARADHVIWLACLSGMLSTFGICTGNAYFFWVGPGVLFGLLVLAPWSVWCGLPWGQTLLMVVLSTFGYATAVYTLMAGSPFFAGLVGSTITFGPFVLFGHPRLRSAACSAGAVGWLLGLLFVMPFLAYVGAIGIWQMGVAFFLANALRIDERR